MQNSNIDKISVPSFQFTSDVDTNLHKIFKLIHKSKLYFERFIIKEQTFQLRSVSNIHPEKFISHYSSYPSFIQDHLETIEKNLITFSFTIKQHTFYINIINKKNQQFDLDNYIEFIYRWLYVCSHFPSDKTCSNVLHIYFFPSQFKKLFPKTRKTTLNVENCNTAFTTSCQPETSIHIYREEEWFKVFIHETFHSMGLDFSEMNQYSVNKYLKKYFPLSIQDFKLYECYCEMFAELIHIMFSCDEDIKEDNLISKVKEKIKEQQKFALLQTVKILHHYDMTYDDFIKENYTYNENTPVFSYYILKSFLFLYIDEYLDWCFYHNKSIQFNKNNENLGNFCRFITNLHEDKYKSFKIILQNIAKDIGKDKDKTLKMTITDFP